MCKSSFRSPGAGDGCLARSREGRTVIARSSAPQRLRQTCTTTCGTGAAADPLGVRTAYVRDYFARMLDTSGLDVSAGTLDPFIDYVADKISRTVPEATPGPETGKTGTEP